MANILVNLEHGVEVGATDFLKFLTTTQAIATKMEPGVLAALGVLFGATETALTAVSQSAATPLNIALDVETVNDLRAVWPAVVGFAQSLGIKV